MRIMSLKLFVFLWSSVVLAQTGERERISNRYYKGPVLIYDCRDRHFVCVDQVSADDCHQGRTEALKKNRFDLVCAPLKVFKTEPECVAEHYRRVHEGVDKSWCYNERRLRF